MNSSILGKALFIMLYMLKLIQSFNLTTLEIDYLTEEMIGEYSEHCGYLKK